AITVERLIAAADFNGKPSASVRNGTRKMPPPSPRTTPSAPATAPAPKMTSASGAVRVGNALMIAGGSCSTPCAEVLFGRGGAGLVRPALLSENLELRAEAELQHPRLIRQRRARERLAELRVRLVQRERLEVG